MRAILCAAAVLGTVAAGNLHADDAGVKVNAALAGSSGAEVFSHICQGCHMPQAQGASGAGHYPKLAGDPALASRQYVAVTVLLGRHAMPAFGKPADPAFVFGEVHISDGEIADVVNYVRSHFGNHYKDKTTAAQVAALPHPDN
jgi:mono/diheme cytochrome c family protein